ncbi:isochorismatase family protein [Hyphomonas sp. CY54-11-8]|uniref:isochorismatase family protein n=1 Tax=Hyphomonas sp. CY54-11-8 TaxID=1280944 RepID=UPI000458DBAF|nr:isochorismatase family protein [Hyphomonas sp. CY54-11-8]KCZ48470.1 hypothetical protein HY17_16600 [Hyphomonas sp. CY54-11-8]
MAGEPILVARYCALVIIGEATCPNILMSVGEVELVQLEAVAAAIGAPVIDLVDSCDFLIDDSLRARIAEKNRRTLILCGGWLEGAVTQVALSSLLEGYDVYVCADQVVTEDPGREHVFLERIRFCNGHIVTTRQIILEFLSQEKDPAARAPLEALLNSGAAG